MFYLLKLLISVNEAQMRQLATAFGENSSSKSHCKAGKQVDTYRYIIGDFPKWDQRKICRRTNGRKQPSHLYHSELH